MPLSRRSVAAALAGLAVLPGIRIASAQPASAIPERAAGSPDAKIEVQEWFSLTCTHCAEFQRVTFPEVKAKLIDTGRIRYVWRDYPLDQVALTAAMVARALPPERYEPFISALLATQDRWAFARGVNNTEELAKYAALAGMPRSAFDAAIGNADLKRDILAAQAGAEKEHAINSTPSFLFNHRMLAGAMQLPPGRMLAGAMQYPAFQQAVEAEPAG